MKKILVFTVIILLICRCNAIKEIKYLRHPSTFRTSSDTIFLNGLIEKRTFKQFTKIIEEQPRLNIFVLENVPGSINDEFNIKMALLVHAKNFKTVLMSNSIIASGGVDLFLAGKSRKIMNGAKVGVHSWADDSLQGSELSKTDSLHNLFLDYYKSIGIDESFYWFTLEAASADSLHWMTDEEMVFYKLEKH